MDMGLWRFADLGPFVSPGCRRARRWQDLRAVLSARVQGYFTVDCVWRLKRSKALIKGALDKLITNRS
eukprot:g76730.t1